MRLSDVQMRQRKNAATARARKMIISHDDHY